MIQTMSQAFVDFTLSTVLKDKWIDQFQMYSISFAYCGYSWLVLLIVDHSFDYIGQQNDEQLDRSFFFFVQILSTCDVFLVNCNVLNTNNIKRYEISIKFVILYNYRLLMPKYHTLVMNCLYLRLVIGLSGLTEHNLYHVPVICGLCFLHGAKRQVRV